MKECKLLSLSSPLTQLSLNSKSRSCQIQEEEEEAHQEEVLVQLEELQEVEEILHNYPIQTIPQSHQVSPHTSLSTLLIPYSKLIP